MSNAWDDKRKAQEESFFDKQNKEALAKLAKRVPGEARKSPVTGKPMEPRVIDGVTVDVCLDSGGMWFDAGEFETLVKIAVEKEKAQTNSGSSWLSSFFGGKS